MSPAVRTSPIWNYFELSKEDGRLAVCLVCNVRISRGGEGKRAGTSSLRNHLESKHPLQFANITTTPSSSRSTISLSGGTLHKVKPKLLQIESENEVGRSASKWSTFLKYDQFGVLSQDENHNTGVVEHNMPHLTPQSVDALTPATNANDYKNVDKQPYVKLELYSESESELETTGNNWSNAESQQEAEVVKEDCSESQSISTVENQQLQAVDDDYNFVMSILPYIRRIPLRKKLSVRVQIMETIDAHLQHPHIS